MQNHLAALWKNITLETLAAYPDFTFPMDYRSGDLVIDCRAEWEPVQSPEMRDVPFFTIAHDGEQFFVSRFRWNDRKKYKTLAGAAKYINGELKDTCDRRRKQKADDDAKREHERNSVQLLQGFRDSLASKGIESKLCLIADRYNCNHLCVQAARINVSIDITVTKDYQLEFAFTYPRFYAKPEAALDILSALSRKGSA